MKLRRSDFAIWDYPKRTFWRTFKRELGNKEIHPQDNVVLQVLAAMLIKRAKGLRGIVALERQLSKGFTWLLIVGMVMEDRHFGPAILPTILTASKVNGTHDGYRLLATAWQRAFGST